MRRFLVSLSIVLPLATARAWAQPEQTPAIDGYVTRYVSRDDFDVNGLKVVVMPGAMICQREANKTLCNGDIDVALGERASVFGQLNKRNGNVAATCVTFKLSAAFKNVSGFAVIDQLPEPGRAVVAPGERLIRADGYRILINPRTKSEFESPLNSIDDVTTNVWIEYDGMMRADGAIVARNAVFHPNTIKPSEDRLRTKNEYDPAVVDDGDKQSGLSKAIKGLDIKRIPAYKDAAMQARVEDIGRKLIPEYQRRLPDGDETKLQFRFQVVDSKWRCVWTEANGIVLVTKSLVERMENDSQLAATVASGIARVMEKHEYRFQPTKRALQSAFMAGVAAGTVVPGGGIVTSIALSKAGKELYRPKAEQQARITLNLMNDAGYDVSEAPKAFWLLQSKNPKPLAQLEIPDQSAYIYETLATPPWRNSPNSDQ